jgi:hypothetical protein
MRITPRLVALALAVAAAAACEIGLVLALGAYAWVGWLVGLVLAAVVVLRLGAHVLDERSIAAAQEAHRAKTEPEPPYRPLGPAPDQL